MAGYQGRCNSEEERAALVAEMPFYLSVSNLLFVHRFATAALPHHIQEAVTSPVAEDSFALQLLFHDVPLVQAQTCRALNLEELESLVQSQKSKGQHWKAAQVLRLVLSNRLSVPKAKRLELAQVVIHVHPYLCVLICCWFSLV